jgi:hypothetical protein
MAARFTQICMQVISVPTCRPHGAKNNVLLLCATSMALLWSWTARSATTGLLRRGAFFAWLALAIGSNAATLSNPRRIGSNFEFSIVGASNAIYAIEGSLDLQNWRLMVTNRQIGEMRTISLATSAQEEFYRVRLLQPLFTGALGARDSVSIPCSNSRVDSFDSADPLASTDGQYDPAKARDHGDIVMTWGLTNSANIGNAKVYGALRVTSSGGTVLGPSASVGSSEWVNSAQVGIEPGHLIVGTNRVFVHVELPPGHVYVTPGPGSVNGTNYTCVLSNGHYALPQLLGSTVVTGRATLYVSGSLQAQTIMIARDASLDLYVGGGSAAINRVLNESGNASAFAYYGLPGNTNVSVNGSELFTGTIYAPTADVGISGGGNDLLEFVGAIIGRRIIVRGALRMHYDERLGLAGPVW